MAKSGILPINLCSDFAGNGVIGFLENPKSHLSDIPIMPAWPDVPDELIMHDIFSPRYGIPSTMCVIKI